MNEIPLAHLQQPKPRRFGWLRGVVAAALIALPATSSAQVSVTVVQEGTPGPRSLCRVEVCNYGDGPVQLGGGMVSQIATLGGFPVVSAGEEERERADAEAGIRRTIKDTAKRLMPVLIQGAAVLAVAKRYPVHVQGALTVAAVAVEMIPSGSRPTVRYLRSSETLALPALGCDVRYIRARTDGWNAPLHKVIGAAPAKDEQLSRSMPSNRKITGSEPEENRKIGGVDHFHDVTKGIDNNDKSNSQRNLAASLRQAIYPTFEVPIR